MELVHPDDRPAVLANIAEIVSRQNDENAGCEFPATHAEWLLRLV